MPTKSQVLALLELGWSYRRIEAESGVRRETVSRYDEARRSNAAQTFAGSTPRPRFAAAIYRTRAQSTIDRFTSNAYDLVLEGESYRPRLKPTLTNQTKERSRSCAADGPGHGGRSAAIMATIAASRTAAERLPALHRPVQEAKV